MMSEAALCPSAEYTLIRMKNHHLRFRIEPIWVRLLLVYAVPQ